MTQPAGRTFSLTRARQWMCDLVANSRRVPTGSLQRSLQLAALRQALGSQPSWCALFTKAYAIVAAARPELRRVYVDWPWPRFYEHTENFAIVAVERCLENEVVAGFAHLRQPQNLTLQEIEEALRQAPLELRLRGTFGITADASAGAALLHVLKPLTTTLTFGAVDEKGTVDMRLTFDRRVLDGATAARVLLELHSAACGLALAER